MPGLRLGSGSGSGSGLGLGLVLGLGLGLEALMLSFNADSALWFSRLSVRVRVTV